MGVSKRIYTYSMLHRSRPAGTPRGPSAWQGMEVKGLGNLLFALKVLPDKVQQKVLSQAGRYALRPVTAAAKANAKALGRGKETREQVRQRRARDHHRLWETIITKGRRYPGAYWLGVGPKYESSRQTGPIQHGYKGNIGHLVEFGHEKVLFGHRTGGRVRGYPFLKPAWDANVSRVKQRLVEGIRIRLEREAAKLGRRR